MMHLTRLWILRGLLLSFLCLSLFGVAVKAAEAPAPLEGLSISPSVVERDVAPGDTLNLNLKINNFDKVGVTLFLEIADFTSDPVEGGKPLFTDEPNPRSLSGWVDLSTTKVYLSGGERKEIPYTLKIPLDAEPGSHYGAVIFSRQDPSLTSGSRVGATSEVGSLIFTRVAGEIFEKGSLLGFSVSKKWYQEPPAIFEVRFQNTGNVQIKPTGIIEITNIAGMKEGVIQINRGFGSVLPDSTRRFEEKWEPKKWFGFIPPIGPYQAEGLLTFGTPSTTIKLGNQSFWLVPWNFILIIAAIIFGFLLTVWMLLRFYARQAVARYKRDR